MRNRAKCKNCGDIIESFHRYDYVYCQCNEIGISGGSDEYHVAAKDFGNFLRIDDDGNEVKVLVKDKVEIVQLNTVADFTRPKLSRFELLRMLDETRQKFESLPVEALYAPVSHADFCSLLLLLSAIFRSENEMDKR
jgi:hypothetical protein